MESLLLCTFAHSTNKNLIIDYINQNYELERDCIFLFENEKNPRQIYFTYNVIECDHFIEDTILIHRKKESNTLYTINAMNHIIIRANNGVLDKSFKLEWGRYSNSLLITNELNLVIIPLNLIKVIKN